MISRGFVLVAFALGVLVMGGCEQHRTKGTHNCANQSDDYFTYWLTKPKDNAKVYASPEEATARILSDGCTVHKVESDLVRACCKPKE
jgi:hypothetical protein